MLRVPQLRRGTLQYTASSQCVTRNAANRTRDAQEEANPRFLSRVLRFISFSSAQPDPVTEGLSLLQFTRNSRNRLNGKKMLAKKMLLTKGEVFRYYWELDEY